MDFPGNKRVAVILYWLGMQNAFFYYYKILSHYYKEISEYRIKITYERPKHNVPECVETVKVNQEKGSDAIFSQYLKVNTTNF